MMVVPHDQPIKLVRATLRRCRMKSTTLPTAPTATSRPTSGPLASAGAGSSSFWHSRSVFPFRLHSTQTEIDTWYANKFARMVGLFDSVSEGGGTLLDNTATLWLPELSDGMAHNLNNLPILIAGSAGGYLKQGVAVNVEGTPIGLGGSSHSCDEGATIASAGSTGGNVPINKLYVTLMNALGCTADDGGKVTEFGVFDGMNAAPGIANPGESSGLVAG